MIGNAIGGGNWGPAGSDPTGGLVRDLGAGWGGADASRVLQEQRAFARVLNTAERGPARAADRVSGETSAEELERRAYETSEQLVAQTFIQPVLKGLREQSEAAPPFAPTQAERTFGAFLDARIAQEVTKAARPPLVDQLARRMLGMSGTASAAGVAADPSPGATTDERG